MTCLFHSIPPSPLDISHSKYSLNIPLNPHVYLEVVNPVLCLEKDELGDASGEVDEGVREITSVQRLVRAMQPQLQTSAVDPY